MNELTKHFDVNGYSAVQQVEALNQLSDIGLISDNCIVPEDVWLRDAENAVTWLVNQ